MNRKTIMAKNPNNIKPTTGAHPAGVAHIATLDLVAATLERLDGRRSGLPGIAVLHGPAGWGKTFATNVLANELRAYYVQWRSAWRSKTLLEKILFEMGVKQHGRETVPKLLDMVCEQLSTSRRTLILDEFDYATKNDTLIELTRDIYEGSQGSLLLVGEELLPKKLEKWERFHSRVLTWAPAQPVTVDDAAKLANIYAPGLQIDDAVFERLVDLAKGSVRRVSVNLTQMHEHSLTHGVDEFSMAEFEQVSIYTGRSPERRL
ncbi:AAA+ ATPase domain-containing protein [Cupriavidus sp. H19C3]|uniref:AAA family ATPase n=1 Tax=Cupriavidus sp. H19C3 TaxID=3241603 RepID=UPI003BF84831